MLDLAVVVVSFNVCDLLHTTLRSLHTSLANRNLQTEIVVVDNASHDESAAMVRREFPGVTLLEPGENLGFARANNLALHHLGFAPEAPAPSSPPFAVWLLNPDTEVVADAPAQLVARLRAAPAVGAVGSRLAYGDGRFQHSAFAFPGLAQIALDLFPLHPRLLESRLNGRYAQRLYQGHTPFGVDMLLGASLMIRGQTLLDVGLLDTEYFMYAEEMDWCRRCKQAGWTLEVVPTALVIHHEGQSTRQVRAEMQLALWRSRLRYYAKFEHPLYLTAVRGLLRLGVQAGRVPPRVVHL